MENVSDLAWSSTQMIYFQFNFIRSLYFYMKELLQPEVSIRCKKKYDILDQDILGYSKLFEILQLYISCE